MEAKSLLRYPAFETASSRWKPFNAGWFTYFAWLAVYLVAQSDCAAVTLWKSASTNSWEVQVSPYVWMTGSMPAALILALFAMKSAHVFGTERPSLLKTALLYSCLLYTSPSPRD